MRALNKRLHRLEETFGPKIETEETRRLRERLNEARGRMAAYRKEKGLPEPIREDNSGLTMREILNRGRLRARESAIAEANKVATDNS